MFKEQSGQPFWLLVLIKMKRKQEYFRKMWMHFVICLPAKVSLWCASGTSAVLKQYTNYVHFTKSVKINPVVTKSHFEFFCIFKKILVHINRFLFFAHLSTKCSWWAIVTGLCPSSIVVRRPSCVNFLAHLSTKCSRWAFVMVHCPSSIVRLCVRQQFL